MQYTKDNMQPNRILKIVTLTAFSLLMTGFVAYRSGAFTSTNPSNLSSSSTGMEFPVDSPPPKANMSPSQVEMMSSSKSAIIYKPIAEDSLKTMKDTGKVKQVKKDTLKKKTYMGSSKSGYIYVPEPKPDTTKKTPKK